MRAVLLAVSLAAFGIARGTAQIGAHSCSSLPLATFSYDRALPLDLRDSVAKTQDGVEIHAISFASPRGGRATGLLFVPQKHVPGVRLPGLVMQHGMPGKAEYVSWVSGNIAHHGAIVVALDAPFARRAGDPVTFTPQDSAEQVQLIVDLQRAFDLLIGRPDVDVGRLAFVGRSYGAAMGGLLAAVEHRPRTYVLTVGDGGLVTHYSAAGHRAALDSLSSERRERWLAAMRPIEPIRYIGCATGASFFFQAARRDELVTMTDAVALQRKAGKGALVRSGSQPRLARHHGRARLAASHLGNSPGGGPGRYVVRHEGAVPRVGLVEPGGLVPCASACESSPCPPLCVFSSSPQPPLRR